MLPADVRAARMTAARMTAALMTAALVTAALAGGARMLARRAGDLAVMLLAGRLRSTGALLSLGGQRDRGRREQGGRTGGQHELESTHVESL